RRRWRTSPAAPWWSSTTAGFSTAWRRTSSPSRATATSTGSTAISPATRRTSGGGRARKPTSRTGSNTANWRGENQAPRRQDAKGIPRRFTTLTIVIRLALRLCVFALLFCFMHASERKTESLVLGGGCFWCTEAAYKLLPGVTAVTPGYAGGQEPNPTYEQVCAHATGH